MERFFFLCKHTASHHPALDFGNVGYRDRTVRGYGQHDFTEVGRKNKKVVKPMLAISQAGMTTVWCEATVTGALLVHALFDNSIQTL